MNRPVIIIGAGGHAAVVADALMASGIEVVGFTDADPRRHGGRHVGLPVLGADEHVLSGYRQDDIMLANGIGATEFRQKVQTGYQQTGWRFMTVQHPSAIVSRRAQIGSGVQMLAGSIVQIGASIGEGSIVNTGAVIEHDCEVGSFVHAAPRALLCGEVKVGSGSHIGAGAVVKQGLRLGPHTLVGAGAVVVKDFGGHGVLVGTPARLVESAA
ncbi:acetyltransferase [Bradyrhizobium sp. 200]|uniref:acetyltransferase n=1 Tax=Bradyrhizobium sp. 200 TaxID=2782665 RepID=UPI001FFE6753|nr:acetyltransferase [Bradyrhizobium sp. 200]UPJ51962.1 acetyltransferase [Bradyrhizobium sp. 200]